MRLVEQSVQRDPSTKVSEFRTELPRACASGRSDSPRRAAIGRGESLRATCVCGFPRSCGSSRSSIFRPGLTDGSA